MRGDWVPNPAWETPVDFVVGDPPTNVLLLAARDQGVGGEVSTMEVTDDLVAERVVGDVFLANSDMTNDRILVVERIRLGLYDNSGQGQWFSDDFLSAAEANEPFLWQRVQTVQTLTVNNDSLSHRAWSFVDVRVQRRIPRDRALYYSIQGFGVPDNRMSARVMLRTWARPAK